MKVRFAALGAAMALVGAVAVASFAEDKAAAKPAEAKMAESKPAMGGAKSTFLLIAAHTAEECKAAQAEMGKMGDKPMGGTMYASCMHGDHTCYITVEADSADAAKGMIPSVFAKSAKVVQVDKMSPEMMKQAHEGAAKK